MIRYTSEMGTSNETFRFHGRDSQIQYRVTSSTTISPRTKHNASKTDFPGRKSNDVILAIRMREYRFHSALLGSHSEQKRY